MQFQIRESNGDYIVEAYIIEDAYSLRGYWHPLRNFGPREGDAIAFREYDCPKLTDVQIRQLINHYDRERRYTRVNGRQFKISNP